MFVKFNRTLDSLRNLRYSKGNGMYVILTVTVTAETTQNRLTIRGKHGFDRT